MVSFRMSWIFNAWLAVAALTGAVLFWMTDAAASLPETWFYPLIMVVGAFVAGLTPEGGGAVAFPVLSVFLEIERGVARDFSLMIQSIGMTSASIYILTRPGVDLRSFAPLLWAIPACCAGFAIGMLTLQEIPLFILQALFLALIASFSLAYLFNTHRGSRTRLVLANWRDTGSLLMALMLGGFCASLFGTGADILLYALLVARFRSVEKTATQMSIMLMAATSLFGFAWRSLIDGDLTLVQYHAWLAAWPVVLIMAPLGAFILSRINIEWMLRAIVILNIGQLVWFNLKAPSMEKLVASAVFTLVLLVVFGLTLAKVSRNTEVSDIAPGT